MTLQYKLTTVCKPLSIWRNSFLLSFYFLLSFMPFASYATTDFTLFENDQKLYLAPYSNYEYLLSLSPLAHQQSNERHILWLQQKAALEYLLIKPKLFNSSVIAARKLLSKTSKSLVKAKLIFYSGIIAQQNNEFNKAAELFDKAISFVNDNTLLYVEIKKAMLLNQHITELLDDSLEGLQLAYIDSFSQADNFTIALINQSYGDIYRYNEEFDTALDYYFKAYETYEQFGYSRHFEQVLYSIALTHRDNNNRKEALESLEHYEKSLMFINEAQQFLISYGYATIFSSSGKSYFSLEPEDANSTNNARNEEIVDCQKALVYINKGLSQQGSLIFRAELLKRKVRCLIYSADYQSAQQLLIEINQLYSNLPAHQNTSWQLETLQLSAQISYAKQNYETAFFGFERFYKQSLVEQKQRSDFRYNINERLLLSELNQLELSLIEFNRKNNEQLSLIAIYKKQGYKYSYILLGLIVFFVTFIIIQNKKSQKTLRSITTKDSITGLYNRNYMMAYWHKLLQASSHKRKVSILLIEVDNILIINDCYGYKVKEQLLCQLVSVLQKCLRTEDVLGHLDNGTFLCVLPRIDEMLTIKIAERLVQLVQSNSFSVENEKDLKVTISVGVRIIEASSKGNVDKFYNELLQALSRAKKLGKNQAVIYRERYTQKNIET